MMMDPEMTVDEWVAFFAIIYIFKFLFYFVNHFIGLASLSAIWVIT